MESARRKFSKEPKWTNPELAKWRWLEIKLRVIQENCITNNLVKRAANIFSNNYFTSIILE